MKTKCFDPFPAATPAQAAEIAALAEELDALRKTRLAALRAGQPLLPAERVVALNRERAAEEAAGQVRWLRPTFQAPSDAASAARREQLALATDAAALPDWPKLAPDQFTTLRAALKRHGPAAPGDLARQFRGATRGKVAGILATLATLGQLGPGLRGRAATPRNAGNAPVRLRQARRRPAAKSAAARRHGRPTEPAD